jgi:hypothetical protein
LLLPCYRCSSNNNNRHRQQPAAATASQPANNGRGPPARLADVAVRAGAGGGDAEAGPGEARTDSVVLDEDRQAFLECVSAG